MNRSIDKFTNVNFSERLSLLIADSGKDNKEVASESGVSEASITNYTRHKRWPKIPELQKLARYFGVTPDFLLGWDEANRTVSETATIAASLAERLGKGEEAQQQIFNEYVALIYEVKSASRQLTEKLEELEQKTRLFINRAPQKKVSSKPTSASGGLLKRAAAAEPDRDPE